MESDADRASMLRGLGGSLFETSVGQILAIFDNEFVDGVEVEGRQPVLTCRTSDVERLRVQKGATVAVEAANYRVRRHEPDGTGLSRLILES